MHTKTHTEQLAEYILNNLNKGYTLDSLRYSLISQGYTKISVENAIHHVNKKLAENIPPIKEKPQISYKIIDETNQKSEIIIPKKESLWEKWFG